jgi:hypothetical protein
MDLPRATDTGVTIWFPQPRISLIVYAGWYCDWSTGSTARDRMYQGVEFVPILSGLEFKSKILLDVSHQDKRD